MRTRGTHKLRTAALALLGMGACLLPANASGTYVEMAVEGNRFQASNGAGGLAVVLVNVEDFDNPALEGLAIEDVAIQGNLNPPVLNDDPNNDTATDFPSWRFKNPSGPPGASVLIAGGLVSNLGDGEYGFTVQPSVDGIWRSGEYVIQVRLVRGQSLTHNPAQTLCGTATAKIVIP